MAKKTNWTKILAVGIIILIFILIIGFAINIFTSSDNFSQDNNWYYGNPYQIYNSSFNYTEKEFMILCQDISHQCKIEYSIVSDEVAEKVYNLKNVYYCDNLHPFNSTKCFNENFATKRNCIDYIYILPLKNFTENIDNREIIIRCNSTINNGGKFFSSQP